MHRVAIKKWIIFSFSFSKATLFYFYHALTVQKYNIEHKIKKTFSLKK